MIHFFLNIDKYYESELDSGLETIAMICIEYPVIHMIAQTIETMEEEFDELDKFIVQVAYSNNGYHLNQFSELTGLNKGVFSYRGKELVKQKYITLEDEIIFPIEKGVEFLNNPTFEREIQKTRSFLVDGVTHEPLKGYFYKDGNQHFVTEEQKDFRGFKIFNPSLVYTPPNKDIIGKVLSIPEHQRLDYCIPVGLKSISDYDFSFMTYPIILVISKDKAGKISRKLIDGFSQRLNVDTLNAWQSRMEKEIQNCHIFGEEFQIDGRLDKIYILKSSWGTQKIVSENAALDVSKFNIDFFIKRQYNLSHSIVGKYEIGSDGIKLKVDRTFFEGSGTDKRKLIEACLRHRDYLRQRESMGVWLLFFEIIIADDFVSNLIKLSKLLNVETSANDLLREYNNNYKQLREGLVALDRFDKLEELDIELFLYSRNKISLSYLSIENG